MAGQLSALVHQFLPGDQAPTQNPLYGATWNDDDQEWQDQSGNSLPDKHQKTLNDAYDNSDNGNISNLTNNYYATPDWKTKVFQPKVAQQENELASQWNAKGPLEVQQEAIQQGINAGRADTVRPYIGQPVPTIPSKALGILAGGNLTSQNISGIEGTQSDVGNANPQTESGTLAQKLAIEDRRNKALIAGDYGTVSAIDALTGARAGTEQNVNTSFEAKANRPSITPAGQLRRGTIESALGRQPVVEQANDVAADTSLRNAVMQAGISKDDLNHFDQILNEHSNNRRFQTMKSAYSPAQEPGLYLNTASQVGPSPLAGNLTSRINASIKGGGNIIPIGGGLNIVQTSDDTNKTSFVAPTTMPQRTLRTIPAEQREETPIKGTLAQQINQPVGSAAYSGGSGKGQSFGDMFDQLGKSLKSDTSAYAHKSDGTVATYFKEGKGTVAISKDDAEQFEQNPDGSLKTDKSGNIIPKQIQSNND